MKKRLFRCILFAAAIIASLGVAILLPQAFPGLDFPRLYLTGSLESGRIIGSIPVTINGKTEMVKIYKAPIFEQSNRNLPCLVLYRPPLPGMTFRTSMKISRNSLFTLDDSRKHFMAVGPYLYAGSAALPSYPLEDDMKGWDAEYHIKDQGQHMVYRIFPSSCQPNTIVFSIPKRWFDKTHDGEFTVDEQHIIDGSRHIVLPYRNVSRVQKGGNFTGF